MLFYRRISHTLHPYLFVLDSLVHMAAHDLRQYLGIAYTQARRRFLRILAAVAFFSIHNYL